MAKQEKIIVKGTEIIFFKKEQEDYISLTDIAKTRDTENPSQIISLWMRTYSTIEYLGLWEMLFNPFFKPHIYEGFKIEEQKAIGWTAKREFAKINYHIHTDAIKHNLIPPELTPQQISYVYANEADVLNVALFGTTAKEWRDQNPDLKGNIRDYATINELICLSNMENINAVLINDDVSQSERLMKLNQIAIQQMRVLQENANRKYLN